MPRNKSWEHRGKCEETFCLRSNQLEDTSNFTFFVICTDKLRVEHQGFTPLLAQLLREMQGDRQLQTHNWFYYKTFQCRCKVLCCSNPEALLLLRQKWTVHTNKSGFLASACQAIWELLTNPTKQNPAFKTVPD